jgi:hypothetical protein
VDHRDILLGDVDQFFQASVLRFQSRRRGEDPGISVALIDAGEDFHHALEINKFDVFARRQSRLLQQHARGEVGGRARHRDGQYFSFQVGQRSHFRLRVDRHHGAIQDAGDINYRLAVQASLDYFAAGIDDLKILANQRLRGCGGGNVADVDVQIIFGEEISVRRDPERREGAAERRVVRSNQRGVCCLRPVWGADKGAKNSANEIRALTTNQDNDGLDGVIELLWHMR